MSRDTGAFDAQGPVVTVGEHALEGGILSMTEVLAQSVANMAPSAAMALLPLLVFSSAGNGTWVSFVIAIVLMLCVGYCAAQFGRRINSAGSFYVWVSRALGPAYGHAAGWGLELGYVATGVATVYGFAIFGGDLLTRLGLPGDSAGVLVVLFGIDLVLAAVVAILDMGLSARMSLTLESFSVAIILLLCVAVWVHRGGVIDPAQLRLSGATPGGVFVGVVLAIFAFVGFESAGSLGVEAKNSFRNVPRAILWSCLLVGLFYLVVSYSQVFGFQGTRRGLAGSSAPLPDLAVATGMGVFAYLIDLGIVTSMFACTLACLNAGARVLYAMTHDGLGHWTLGSVHPTRRTPHVAIVIVAIPMILVPLATTLLRRSPVDATGWVGSLAVFGFMLGYVLVAVGAPLFLRRLGVRSPLTWVVGLLGAAVMLFVFWANSLPQSIPGRLFPPLQGVYEWLPLVFVAWVAVGAAYYAVWRWRNPEKARTLGTRFHTPEGAPATGD
ncbi:MAG TPA: APC family permease [Candidatus Dormibacteraeota bacterium]|nr:APC family permease [Candidatus Dormibacteraeota bacterium]